MERRLYRSERDAMIGGVCGGLAEYFDIDPVWVRLAFAVLAITTGVGLVAYIVLWIIVPRQSRVGATTQDVVRENVEQLREKARELGEEVRSTFTKEAGPPTAGQEESMAARPHRRQPYLFGGILILLGIIFLLSNLGLFWWFRWGSLWPLILIALGIAFLIKRRRR